MFIYKQTQLVLIENPNIMHTNTLQVKRYTGIRFAVLNA